MSFLSNDDLLPRALDLHTLLLAALLTVSGVYLAVVALQEQLFRRQHVHSSTPLCFSTKPCAPIVMLCVNFCFDLRSSALPAARFAIVSVAVFRFFCGFFNPPIATERQREPLRRAARSAALLVLRDNAVLVRRDADGRRAPVRVWRSLA